jgi:hypothetical protein
VNSAFETEAEPSHRIERRAWGGNRFKGKTTSSISIPHHANHPFVIHHPHSTERVFHLRDQFQRPQNHQYLLIQLNQHTAPRFPPPTHDSKPYPQRNCLDNDTFPYRLNDRDLHKDQKHSFPNLSSCSYSEAQSHDSPAFS